MLKLTEECFKGKVPGRKKRGCSTWKVPLKRPLPRQTGDSSPDAILRKSDLLGTLKVMIPEQLLKKYGASLVTLTKGQTLFREGDRARSFFIVRSGTIRMVNYNREGREFVQGLFVAGESFGEPPFFTDTGYPASAEATEPSEVWRIPRAPCLELLKDNFDVQLLIVQTLCSRLIYKSTMLSELAIEEAEHRIVTLLRHLSSTVAGADRGRVRIPFTRKQMADMTGLRVETVIRSIKSLENKGMLEIDRGGKVLWLSGR